MREFSKFKTRKFITNKYNNKCGSKLRIPGKQIGKLWLVQSISGKNLFKILNQPRIDTPLPLRQGSVHHLEKLLKMVEIQLLILQLLVKYLILSQSKFLL